MKCDESDVAVAKRNRFKVSITTVISDSIMNMTSYSLMTGALFLLDQGSPLPLLLT